MVFLVFLALGLIVVLLTATGLSIYAFYVARTLRKDVESLELIVRHLRRELPSDREPEGIEVDPGSDQNDIPDSEPQVADREKGDTEESAPTPPDESAESRQPWILDRVAARISRVDWERFTGRNLFAWVGGLALFLGILFMLQYAYEQGLINPSPLAKVAGAFVLGIGLLIAALYLKQDPYRVTIHTFAASGCAILYADTYAAHAFYGFIPGAPTFVLMILITVAAFLLADRLVSLYVALLGLLGGFLTPPLLASGSDQPLFLFSYIAFLDLGLITLALRRRWEFLIGLAALATFLTEWGWTLQHFSVSNVLIGAPVFVLFSYLFCSSYRIQEWLGRESRWGYYPAVFMPLGSMSFVCYLLEFWTLGHRPWVVLTTLILLELPIAYLAIYQDRSRKWHLLAGLVEFLILLYWTRHYLTDELLLWGLAYYLVFGVLHGGLPVVLQRIRPVVGRHPWGHLYPSLMLMLMMYPLLTRSPASLLIWPFVLVMSLVAMIICWLVTRGAVLVLNLVLIMLGMGIWFTRLEQLPFHPAVLLGLVTLFSLVFFAAGVMFLIRRGSQAVEIGSFDGLAVSTTVLPALSALLPFLLVMVMIVNLPDPSPFPVFGLVLLMTVLILGLVRYQKLDVLCPIVLLAVGAVEYTWHMFGFRAVAPLETLVVYTVFYLLLLAFPFLYRGRFVRRPYPWYASASSGVVHFFLLYDLFINGFGDTFIGLLPAVMAVVTFISLYGVIRNVPDDESLRQTLIALYGGVTLFFVTLVFPVQLEKEWLTISWAGEGLALVWLYGRVPHRGLRRWGLGLLLIAFLRLTLNPYVFSYHPVSGVPVFNWYLYTYGVVAICMFVAAKWIDRPPDTSTRQMGKRWLPATGTILLFILLNIEIADYFSADQTTLTFDFSARLGQDMTYSLGWALFGFGMLVVGTVLDKPLARQASLGLLLITVLKVFLHDLWYLGQLYRVASLIGLALVLIVVSVVYQKYLSRKTISDEA